VIPILSKIEDFSESLRRGEERWVLMPKEIYEEVRIQRNLSTGWVQEFLYKKGKLVLVSMRP
jgi:hypothetical protein